MPRSWLGTSPSRLTALAAPARPGLKLSMLWKDPGDQVRAQAKLTPLVAWPPMAKALSGMLFSLSASQSLGRAVSRHYSSPNARLRALLLLSLQKLNATLGLGGNLVGAHCWSPQNFRKPSEQHEYYERWVRVHGARCHCLCLWERNSPSGRRSHHCRLSL